MNKSFAIMLLAAALVASMSAGSAFAQIYHTPTGAPVIAPPPRPAPPPITVPTVPEMDSPPPFALGNTSPGLVETNQTPQVNLKPLSRRKSYSHRVTRCLQEGAALGLGPGERSAYSRTCAQQ